MPERGPAYRHSKRRHPEKYSVLDNMMLRLTGIEEPSGWRETLASYMKETGGLE
ncbi:MAG: hypothetical protein ACLR6I_00835 [Waltera sp.]